ncbi:MAG: N-acetyltransferase [Gammaproteobacteria bacterium]|nr:N-acetyltransferase [Gammaproteobacteria bacterium]
MKIRTETSEDHAAVDAVNRAAFESGEEADLVEVLRQQADPCISLVAEANGDVVGHIMFSPATLSADPETRVMGLGPMAVIPQLQRQGFGSALVRAGLEACRRLGYEAVFVLGHAQYYPRFGFLPASGYGISSTYDVPDDVFMALELEPGALLRKAGKMHYHRAFDAL